MNVLSPDGVAGQLTLIIVSYNSSDIITQCHGALLETTAIPAIIVDNASRDDSALQLRNKLPTATIIQLPYNIGYGRAANVGLKNVGTPYALLLNPDLTASESQILRLLQHAVTDSDNTAIWGPASEKKEHREAPPEAVRWISGCAMLFDMEKLKETGFFDENIFLFFEEDELCDRVIEAGYRIRYCPDVYFAHLVGQACTSNPAVEYMKWWHFGWSACYLMTRRSNITFWKNPRKKMIGYRLHSLYAATAPKRLKWKAKADGAQAFIRGEKAFDENDRAQHSLFD